jgi:hypothetical protein
MLTSPSLPCSFTTFIPNYVFIAIRIRHLPEDDVIGFHSMRVSESFANDFRGFTEKKSLNSTMPQLFIALKCRMSKGVRRKLHIPHGTTMTKVIKAGTF